MTERWYDDLSVGQKFESKPYKVTAAEIRSFARRYDPQTFHLDAKKAEGTVFRGLAASGWHTGAVTMRLLVEGELRVAGGHVGLGLDELRWPLAVRPGDVLRLVSEIVELRASKSRPDRGIARLKHVTTNQKGETVMSFVSTQLVPRRRD
jgi:acyl dehydratase